MPDFDAGAAPWSIYIYTCIYLFFLRISGTIASLRARRVREWECGDAERNNGAHDDMRVRSHKRMFDGRVRVHAARLWALCNKKKHVKLGRPTVH